MAYRINLQGVIVIYSEELYEEVVQLAENDELYGYISKLLMIGIEAKEVTAKLDQILRAVESGVFTSNAMPVTAPVKREAVEPETVIEKVAPPVSGTAATVLGRLKKINKKT